LEDLTDLLIKLLTLSSFGRLQLAFSFGRPPGHWKTWKISALEDLIRPHGSFEDSDSCYFTQLC
jgi:hypothetical protein